MKPFERPKTEKNGEQWLPDHPWCPNSQIDYGISEVKANDLTWERGRGGGGGGGGGWRWEEETEKAGFDPGSATVQAGTLTTRCEATAVSTLQRIRRASGDLSCLHLLAGLVVKASASRAEDPGFESRLRRDFFGVESYQ